VEVTSIAPSVTPDRTSIRTRGRSRIHRRGGIHRRCGRDRIFINHDRRRRYNDRPANHDDGRRLLNMHESGTYVRLLKTEAAN
jgi:hypothetical protein